MPSLANTYGRPEIVDGTAFAQAWLFFSLLHDYFGVLYNFGDFVDVSEESSLEVVHTRGLRELLERKYDDILILEEHSAGDAYQERIRLQKLLAHAAQNCAKLDHPSNLQTHGAKLPIVLLSVKLLIQTLDVGQWLDRQLHIPHHNDVPSLAPLRDAMLKERGWCWHHVEELGRANTYHALWYLAHLRRYPGPWIDHGECRGQDQCMAYNVNELTHEVLHVEEGCGCEVIEAPETNLGIIEKGNIPFVRCERRKGLPPTGKYAMSNSYFRGMSSGVKCLV